MHFYKYGLLFSIFGIVLFIMTPYLLHMVNDNGYIQRKIVRLTALLFINLGVLFTFIKPSPFIMIFLATAGPWIIYAIYRRN